MGKLITALPKGRMMKPVIKILKNSGLISSNFDIDSLSRELVFEDNNTGNSFLLAKPKDVPAYVEHGAADIGITGKDVIMEHGKKLYELLDLGISKCKLVVAARKADNINSITDIPEHSRVATSYPEITKNFFEQKGIQVEVIYLYGSVELAPLVELADFIVDITSTGTTLRKNNLEPVAEILKSSARLIVNNVSYKTRFNEVKKIITQVKKEE
ncbi:MAG: ATP phosphoribosyltransferase [Bacillota bacterium]